MSKYEFTATHGVSLWDLGVQFTKADDKVNEDGSRSRVYAFGTDDKEIADAVAKVEGYGIKRVASSSPEPEPEPAADDEGDEPAEESVRAKPARRRS